MSFNKIIIEGRLGAEPETRAFPSGGMICNLRVATTDKWKDRTTGEPREHTEWHRVVFRNRQAEIAQQYLHKGSRILIEGQVRTRKWSDNSGNDRFTTEVLSSNFVMLDSRVNDGSMQDHAGGKQYISENSPPETETGGNPYDDDIPFNKIDGRLY